MLNKTIAVLGCVAVLLASSCRVFDSAADCRDICKRYKDCFDQNYGTQSCEERCRDNANSDSNYYRKVDNCDACIDNNTCTAAVFTCGIDCSGVVP